MRTVKLLCPNCMEIREVTERPDRPRRFCSQACASAWTARHRKTTRGFYIDAKGYRQIRRPDHPQASKNGYIMEHRLVMERELGRPLRPDEIVHHKDGNKANNRVKNLEVMPKRLHDRRPKPARKPITCPHCGGTIIVSGRVRHVAAG